MEYENFCRKFFILINNSRNNVCLEDPKIYVRAVRRVFEREGLSAEQVSNFLDNMVSDNLIQIKILDWEDNILLTQLGEDKLRYDVNMNDFLQML